MNLIGIVRAKFLSGAALAVCGALVFGLAASPPSSEASQAKKPNRYIGAQKCKNCHAAAESGNQFDAWTKMKHAAAFAVLASDDAKKVGSERGVTDPQKDDKCVKCHVTAFGVPEDQIAKGFDKTLGVQCESCHGPGEMHMKARMAAAAAEGTEEGFEDKSKAKKYAAVPKEEIIADPPQATCVACHNSESPNFKPFCFHKAKATVRHINPLKPRTAEDTAKLLACGCDTTCACKTSAPDGKCPGETK